MRMSGASWAVVLDRDGRVMASASLPVDTDRRALQRLLDDLEPSPTERFAGSKAPGGIPAGSSSGNPVASEVVGTGDIDPPDDGDSIVGGPIRKGLAPLPGGEMLFVASVDSTQAWSRMTRAFLHDVRGALNSQNLYLGLLRTRLERLGVISDEIEKCLSRLGDQVPRIVGFCDAFATLASTSDRDDPVDRDHDFDTITKAAFEFAKTVGKRKEVAFELSGTCPVRLRVEGVRVGEALVTLFGGILDAPKGSEVTVLLGEGDEGPHLTVSGLPEGGEELIRGGLTLFESLGARVVVPGTEVTIRFPWELVETKRKERSAAPVGR